MLRMLPLLIFTDLVFWELSDFKNFARPTAEALRRANAFLAHWILRVIEVSALCLKNARTASAWRASGVYLHPTLPMLNLQQNIAVLSTLKAT